MPIARGLLLKGLGVCALCVGGAVTIHFKGREIKDLFLGHQNIEVRKIEVAGLECEETDGSECSIKGKVLVKRGNEAHFELTTLGEGSGKIKLYKVKGEGENSYNKDFKFLIEEGDITVSDTNKLEEFETYEVKEWAEGDSADLKGKQYLLRKTDSKTEIKNALGLPWDLPAGDSDEHTGITTENVASIKFKGGDSSLAGENVTLTISKETDKTEFPLGYKFTFKNTSETAATLNIGNEAIKIKNGSPIDYDFKIKRNGSSLSLEKAWSLETFAEKVGLVKDGDFWDVGTTGLNIKVDGSNKKDKKTKKDGTQGKIKVYEGQAEYNGGFRFTIEEGDLVLNDSGSSDIILGQFQSYELVKESDDKWYLFKKDEGQERIKELLGIKCEIPTGQTDCSLTAQNIKNIKFKGGAATLSGGNVTLTITKDTTGDDYPLGFRFSFKNASETDVTLTVEGNSITLKQNSPVDFKIKKEESSLTLEKAWTLETLASKVGLVKQNDGYWFVGNSGMNVKLEEVKKTNKVKYSSPTGRIKVYSDQKEYSEGLKFTIEKGDIDLKEDASGSQTINLGQFQSFEIVKDSDGNWYLSRKEGEETKIKNDLDLPCNLPADSKTPTTCDISGEKIKTIKFEGGTGATSTGNPKLTIHKESGRYNYPLGYRFTFSSEENSSITIPSSPETKITLKKDLSVDYKIKVSGTNKDVLSLEKAWTAEKLMEEASFGSKGGDGAWTARDAGVSIKQGNNKSDDVNKGSGSHNSKIRVYEGSPGYNQGYKFVIEEGDTSLNGNGGISKLTKYETYEVVKDSDNIYYLTKKLGLPESMREILGLPKTCKFPANGNPTECSLSVDELDEVKFDGKGEGKTTITGGGTSVKLKITKESSSTDFPLSYKFTFEEGGFTIPKTDGSLEVNGSSNNEFKIKEAGGKSTLVKKS